MGAKTWMLVYSEGNVAGSLKKKVEIDRNKTVKFLKELFPNEKLTEIEDGDLSYTCPPDDIIYAGCFADIFVVAAKEFGIDYPSKLPVAFISTKFGKTIQLHAMHSVVDWFAFSIWEDGNLKRSLSLSPDNGFIENIGDMLPFEIPFWNGEYPAVDSDEDDYPFQFHPLDLAEAALGELFGYVLEGPINESFIEPENIPLMGFKRAKQWWKFWK